MTTDPQRRPHNAGDPVVSPAATGEPSSSPRRQGPSTWTRARMARAARKEDGHCGQDIACADCTVPGCYYREEEDDA